MSAVRPLVTRATWGIQVRPTSGRSATAAARAGRRTAARRRPAERRARVVASHQPSSRRDPAVAGEHPDRERRDHPERGAAKAIQTTVLPTPEQSSRGRRGRDSRSQRERSGGCEREADEVRTGCTERRTARSGRRARCRGSTRADARVRAKRGRGGDRRAEAPLRRRRTVGDARSSPEPRPQPRRDEHGQHVGERLKTM